MWPISILVYGVLNGEAAGDLFNLIPFAFQINRIREGYPVVEHTKFL